MKVLVRCMDYQKIADDFAPETAGDKSGKFIYAVSLSKSGYALESAALFTDLKRDKTAGAGFKSAVKMNLGVAADKAGLKNIAADCFKEVNSAGLTAPVDMKEYRSYYKYVLEPGRGIPDLNGAKLQSVRINGRNALQVRPLGPKWSIGESGCINSNWEGYEYFVFEVYNPGKKDIVLDIYLRPYKNDPYTGMFRSTMSARPGYTKLEVDLREAMTIEGKKIDFKNPVFQWFVTQNSGESPEVFYVNNFRLEKETPAP